MHRTMFISALLSASCLGASPASAQQQDAAALAAEIAAMRAKIDSLEAKVKQLEGAQEKKLRSLPAGSPSRPARRLLRGPRTIRRPRRSCRSAGCNMMWAMSGAPPA
jgi:outer membrane murein-binding lipoprotein Lpp